MFRQLRGKIILSIVFGVLVIAALSLFADVQKLSLTLRTFGWWLVPPILGLTLFNYALRFLKWQYYLRLIKVRDLSTSDSFGIFFSAFTMVMTPGKVGELLKSYLLRRAVGTPIAKSAPIILAERMTDGIALVILAALGLANTRLGWPVLVITVVGAVAATAIIQHRPTAERLLTFGEGLGPLGPRIHHLRNFYESSYELLRPRPFGIAVLCGLVSWMGECLAFYLVLIGLGLHGSFALLITATSILALATLIGSVSLLPGGLGVADASIAFLLTLTIAAPPMTNDIAVAGALLIRFATLWFGVALGAVMVVIYRRLFSGMGALDTEDERGNDQTRRPATGNSTQV